MATMTQAAPTTDDGDARPVRWREPAADGGPSVMGKALSPEASSTITASPARAARYGNAARRLSPRRVKHSLAVLSTTRFIVLCPLTCVLQTLSPPLISKTSTIR